MKEHCTLHTKITTNFGCLLEPSTVAHYRNYNTKCGLNPPFMKEIFLQRNINYSLRRGAQLPKVRTTSLGVELIAYLGNKLWQS